MGFMLFWSEGWQRDRDREHDSGEFLDNSNVSV